jgi:histidine ammonia-lyase
MPQQFQITNTISLSDIEKILADGLMIELSEKTRDAILRSKEFLDRKVSEKGSVYYGINTGFGSFCNTVISKDQLGELQENLVKSHACGTGDEVPAEIVKLMLLLKIQSLGYGYSGVQLDTVWRLVDMFNLDILPVVYEQGSLGASGDLAPLAHLSLPLIGLGEIWINGSRNRVESIREKLHHKPLKLQAKEGLALLNGTQFMSAYGTWCLIHAKKIIAWADAIAALSADAFLCLQEPFFPQIHIIRPHKGQVEAASNMRRLLEGSRLMSEPKPQVQDPYSFRCIPQVHGATRDVTDSVMKIFETEINSVTDNPNLFADDDMIISGGNFHGQTLALHLDFLAMGLSELANISERRIFKLVSGERGLPPYLVKEGGLQSGMMIAQYTAASIVSQNKQYCSPASVDSIVSSNGQEDHVSMGANAAVKCYKVVQNVYQVLAIELMCAAQALDFRKKEDTSPLLHQLFLDFRTTVPYLENDIVMYEQLHKAKDFLTAKHPS